MTATPTAPHTTAAGSRSLLLVSGIASGPALIAAVVVAIAAARHAHPAEHSPVIPTGDWRAVWTGSVGVALLLYGSGALAASRGAVRLRTATAVAIVVQLVPLGAPLLLSTDVFVYWSDARVVAVHGANPYRDPPSSFPGDPALAVTDAHWRVRTPPYGPAWEALGTLPAPAVGSSPSRAQLAYRVLAALGILASIAMVAVSTRSPGGVAILGWSPLVALHYAGGGHNDAWMIALLVLALAARTRAVGGGGWALATAFKFVPAIFLPLELARTRLHATRRFWAGLVVGSMVIAAGSTAAFGTSWVTPALAATHGSSPMGGVHFLSEAGLRHRYAIAVATIAFAGVYLALLRSAWRTGRARHSLAAGALCMAASQLRPWYGLWPAALAAIEDDPIGAVATYALTVYLVVWDALPL